MKIEPAKQVEQKVMIINWKWLQNKHINATLLQQEDIKPFTDPIKKGEGIFYRKYKVEPSELCPDALVIAVSIYKDNEETQHLLNNIIDRYAKPHAKVMVFLHRSNYYEDDDVEYLLNHFKGRISKCFLFGDGRDYIYFKTQRAGFLDDLGGFEKRRDKITGEKIITFDEETQQVKQPYFDRVWQYYESEFETKIVELKEELFDQWLPFLLPHQSYKINREQLLNAIHYAEDRCLFFRIKSFVGKYDEIKKLDAKDDFDKMNDLKKELDAIKKLEQKEKTSYIFDDCRVNLEYEQKNGRELVATVYHEVVEKLDHLLFKNNGNVFSKDDVRALSQKMEILIKVIPGYID